MLNMLSILNGERGVPPPAIPPAACPARRSHHRPALCCQGQPTLVHSQCVADREGGCDEDAKIRSLSAQAGWMAEHGHICACQAAGLPHEGPENALGAQDRVCTLLDPELWTVLVLVSCSK